MKFRFLKPQKQPFKKIISLLFPNREDFFLNKLFKRKQAHLGIITWSHPFTWRLFLFPYSPFREDKSPIFNKGNGSIKSPRLQEGPPALRSTNWIWIIEFKAVWMRKLKTCEEEITWPMSQNEWEAVRDVRPGFLILEMELYPLQHKMLPTELNTKCAIFLVKWFPRIKYKLFYWYLKVQSHMTKYLLDIMN